MRKNCTPGSVRGLVGDCQSYRDGGQVAGMRPIVTILERSKKSR